MREQMNIINETIKANGILYKATKEPLSADFLSKKGYAVRIGERYAIIINQNTSHIEREFTAAHELGHILMGHLEKSPVNAEHAELEANIFAAVFMAFNAAIRMGGAG